MCNTAAVSPSQFSVNLLSDPESDEENGPLTIFSFITPTNWTWRESEQRTKQVQDIFKTSLRKYLPNNLVLGARESGVTYPVIHLCNDREQLTSPLTEETNLENQFILRQGVYREIRSIKIDTENELDYPTPENVAYLLLGFKSMESKFNQVMVDTWKDWTGALYVYMNLPDELGLYRIRFFLREAPNCINTFMYLVLVECHSINNPDKELLLLDFVRRMRVDRMAGYISVYKISSLL